MAGGLRDAPFLLGRSLDPTGQRFSRGGLQVLDLSQRLQGLKYGVAFRDRAVDEDQKRGFGNVGDGLLQLVPRVGRLGLAVSRRGSSGAPLTGRPPGSAALARTFRGGQQTFHHYEPCSVQERSGGADLKQLARREVAAGQPVTVCVQQVTHAALQFAQFLGYQESVAAQ